MLRLILCLLLAALALPANAAMPCHDAPMKMAMPGDHKMPAKPMRDDSATAPHSCMGCIPPASLRSSVIAQPPAVASASFSIASARFDPGRSAAPALPPPRA